MRLHARTERCLTERHQHVTRPDRNAKHEIRRLPRLEEFTCRSKVRHQDAHNLLAIVAPNIVCKPCTVMITKVTIKGSKQVLHMFGPAQAAVARAVADSVAAGVIDKGQAENLVIVCGVFIHPEAKDDNKIYQYNYDATKLAIARAMKGEPKIDEILSKKDTAKHPFSPK